MSEEKEKKKDHLILPKVEHPWPNPTITSKMSIFSNQQERTKLKSI